MPKDQSNITQTLQSLQKDLFDLSAGNPLVKTDLTKLWFYGSESDLKQAEKIYAKSRFYEKEYALKTLLDVEAFLKWKHPKTGDFYTSPLLFRPATLTKKLRENLSFQVTVEENDFTINPVLRKLMHDAYQLNLPDQVEDSDTIYIFLQNEFRELDRVSEFNGDLQWQIICKKGIGVFNYKKLLLVNDYEKIIHQPGGSINALFGDKEKVDSEIDSGIFQHELDWSQKEAVRTSLHEHTVIQGPPGTGKSHTVVNLIKSFLIQNKRVLFVSEKRAALDVVYQKLKKEKLDLNVAYFNSDKNEKKQFYAHLKKNREKASDFSNAISEINPARPVFNDLFDFYPNRLTARDDKHGLSILDLEEKLLESGLKSENTELKGLVPDYKSWEENLTFLHTFEKQICDLLKIKKLQDSNFIHLYPSVFSDKNPFAKIKQLLSKLDNYCDTIIETSNAYKLKLSLYEITHYAIAASILNMVNRNQLDLLQKDQKKYKTFTTLAKKYQLAEIKLLQAEQVNQKWKKKPTISEITELTELLKQKKKSKSILGILKRNSARSTDYFSDFSPEISTVTKLQLLEEIRTEWHLRNDLDELRIKLKHELNILNPETEIDHILQVRTKLQSINTNEYLKILEHPESLQMIRDFDRLHHTINQLSGILSYLGIHSNDQSLEALKHFYQAAGIELSVLENFEEEVIKWSETPHSVTDFVRKNTGTTDDLDKKVIRYHLNQQSRFEPKYRTLTGDNLLVDFNKRARIFKVYGETLNKVIQTAPARYLKKMEGLAEKPSSRLKEREKSTRKNYKDAKRIITHELNKKQRHLPVAELMGEFAEVILSFQPVWMMNPLSVSNYLPCSENLFDVVIFDEASQVPLEDAIPSIFRASRLIVVGDSHQMPPGNFFTSNPDGKTLLDQATYNLTNKMLTHHYRSKHPALISFSNHHFYDNELLALPSCENLQPIQFVKTGGIFEENKNIREAKSIAAYYKKLLFDGEKDIGIVAFSREQQLEIEKQIQSLNLPENELLLIRNLENIQGNEKEIILISIGYAKNKEGVFRKNFGPLNQERGANRLNVLLTRAIKQLVVFSSVTSRDFGISENRGVELLAGFLKFAEEFKPVKTGHEIKSPTHRFIADYLTRNKLSIEYYSVDSGLSISAFVDHNSGKILLVNPCTENDPDSDLFTTLSALSNRFVAIKIITTTDILANRKRVESELLKFFSA